MGHRHTNGIAALEYGDLPVGGDYDAAVAQGVGEMLLVLENVQRSLHGHRCALVHLVVRDPQQELTAINGRLVATLSRPLQIHFCRAYPLRMP